MSHYEQLSWWCEQMVTGYVSSWAAFMMVWTDGYSLCLIMSGFHDDVNRLFQFMSHHEQLSWWCEQINLIYVSSWAASMMAWTGSFNLCLIMIHEQLLMKHVVPMSKVHKYEWQIMERGENNWKLKSWIISEEIIQYKF